MFFALFCVLSCAISPIFIDRLWEGFQIFFTELRGFVRDSESALQNNGSVARTDYCQEKVSFVRILLFNGWNLASIYSAKPRLLIAFHFNLFR